MINPLSIAADLQLSIERVTRDTYLNWLTRIMGGWLVPGDGNLAVFDFAIGHMPDDGAVLEIGSFLGMSICAMSYMMWLHGRTHPLFTCDPWDFEGTAEPIGGYFDASSPAYRQYCMDVFKRNILVYAERHLPHSVEDYSHRFLARWAAKEEAIDVLGRQVRLGGALSFVYIDGAHTYEAASGDFRGVDPFVLPGGYVFFDDTGEAWGPEMARVVREVQLHPDYELIARTPNYLFRKRLDASARGRKAFRSTQ
jgi:hypothetical protein